MNAVQEARSPGISGPPSSLSCQRRALMGGGGNEIIMCENEKNCLKSKGSVKYFQ